MQQMFILEFELMSTQETLNQLHFSMRVEGCLLIDQEKRAYNSGNDLVEGTDGRGTPNLPCQIINFDVARATLTNHESNFGGNPDYFIDF